MSVSFKDNSKALLAQFEQNKKKALAEVGIKWQEIASKEARAQIYTGTRPKGAYQLTNRYGASLSFATPDEDSGASPYFQYTQPVKEGEKDNENPDVIKGPAPKDTVKVGTNVEYGVWIETGTGKMPARPIIRDSVLKYKDDYEEIIARNLGEGFGISATMKTAGKTKKGVFEKTEKLF